MAEAQGEGGGVVIYVQSVSAAPGGNDLGFEESRENDLAEGFEAFLRETGVACSQAALNEFLRKQKESEE